MSLDNTDMKYSIPVVDFQALSINRNLPSGPEDDNKVTKSCQAVCDAFMDVGFVYLKNTGITEKQAWPDEHVPSFKTVTLDFYESCTKLADRLLFAISTGLDLPDRSYLIKCHQIKEGKSMTKLRLLRYPPVPAGIELKPGQARMEEHTDFSTITLLFQDQTGGLEVQCRDGVYRPATPIDGTVLVNIGDLLQRWTADKLVSNKHRVVVPEEETKRQKSRFSVVFFVSPEPDTIVQCLDGSDKYEPILASDYHRNKYIHFGYEVSKK